MKKALVAIILSSLFALSAIAQTGKKSTASGGYVRVGVGYAFPHAGNTVSTLYDPFAADFNLNGNITQGAGYTTYDLEKVSIGSGLKAMVAGGYWFNKNIGIELGVNIGVAPKKFESVISALSFGNSEVINYAKTPIYIMPALMLRAEVSKIYIYNRLGIAVNVAGKGITESTVTAGSSIQVANMEYTFRTGIGFQGALGVQIPVADKVSIFAEANGLFINQYLKEAELVERTDNGADVLSKYPTAAKQFEFELDYNQTLSAIRPYEPTKAPSMAVPFSNIGLSAGIMIGF